MEHAYAFERHREHLRSVAYRMLGSAGEAEDAVQEAWLRMHRSDTTDIDNLGGWLTTVVARVSLDMLRARKTRAEDPLETAPAVTAIEDPEAEALLADSVGLALLVVLQSLSPQERLAFVLHDMFDLPFTEIATIVGRSPNTAAQLASRARRRVRGRTPDADVATQRRVVAAFLAAARDGDFDGLLAVLDEDVVLRADRSAAGAPEPVSVRGARSVAGRARMFAGNARFADTALIDGGIGVLVAPAGRLALALRFAVVGGVITSIDIVGDKDTLRRLDLAVPG